jgi:Tfp pilus assembly protein PilW
MSSALPQQTIGRSQPALSRRALRAFTLTEVMIATAVSCFMFAAVLTATVVLQRSFSGAMNYSKGTTDQQRALDYIARDLRRAWTVTVSQYNQTLTIQIPDYYSSYDAQGNPSGAPSTPSISTTGKLDYGDPTKPVTICYYLNNGQLLRQQTIEATGSTCTTVVADSVCNLESSFADLTSVVNFTITFAPALSAYDSTNSSARAGTTLIGTTSVRNARRD